MEHEFPSGADMPRNSVTRTPRGRSARAEPASGSKVKVKRWWAIRSSSMLIIAAVILCLFVIWNRDRNTANQCLRLLDPVVKDLQARTTALGVIPADIKDSPAASKQAHVFEYTFSPGERHYAINTSDPTIVAYTPAVPQLLHRAGRCVIIHEKGRIRSAWLTQGEFNRRWQQQQQQMEDFEAKMRSRPVELP